MSTKLQHRPHRAEGGPIDENTPVDSVDTVLSCIRQIQADAEQICSHAAGIEDARFLAENVVNTCSRIIANGHASISNPHPVDRMQAECAVLVAPASTQRRDTSREALARAKLRSLSARELEIFTHLAEGCSAVEIAVKLSRSSKTINNHRTRILQKLGLKNATELVRLALQGGVVSV
ncbi:MAG: LuxR family transcriptional regulator [Gammaproteobacteria bacterium]|nr:MAG: LuxR family transcriptional regulator [Gammaproteobacteria bacterium]